MVARPEHGGQLNAAAKRWGIPREQWLDLSTGINPQGWPVPEIPLEVWRRLPEDDDGLEDTVRDWAGAPASAACLPVAGSQAAIQALPWLRRRAWAGRRDSVFPGRAGVPAPGYQEHAHCWAMAGHKVVALDADGLEAQLEQLNVVVWVQPNNPTGLSLSRERLLDWHARLARRGGWLVVDEAFMNGRQEESLASFSGRQGLIVLRSLGKFFGLAGIRAGAVLAWPGLREELDQALGPWAVSGPTRYLMARAMADKAWQKDMTAQLSAWSGRLQVLLTQYGYAPSGGSLLFQHISHPRAKLLAENLARQGVLVRYFEEPASLRFGLPGTEADWARLQQALAAVDID